MVLLYNDYTYTVYSYTSDNMKCNYSGSYNTPHLNRGILIIATYLARSLAQDRSGQRQGAVRIVQY